MLSRILRLFRRHPEPTIELPTPRALELTNDERQTIRDWLRHPTTRLVLSLVESRHPGLQTRHLGTVPRSEWDERAAVCFLNRARGWEMYRDALLRIAEPPVAPAEGAKETYPNQ